MSEILIAISVIALGFAGYYLNKSIRTLERGLSTTMRAVEFLIRDVTRIDNDLEQLSVKKVSRPKKVKTDETNQG